MDLSQVRYFLTVLETGNFTKAAEQLSVSQPSLSLGIKRLERELGVVLFERDSRRVRPTVAGQSFAVQARLMLGNYEAALYELRRVQQQIPLRLGVLATVDFGRLTLAIARFRDRYPGVLLDVREAESGRQLWDRMGDGEIDVAVTVLEGEERNRGGMMTLPWFSQRFLLALPLAHPLAQQREITADQLATERLIDRVHCEFRQRQQAWVHAHGLNDRVSYRVADDAEVLALLQDELGMALMPEWESWPGVTYVPVEGVNWVRTVGLMWRDRLSPEVNEMVQVFIAGCLGHAQPPGSGAGEV